jgi:HK97 family phage major capsid protein
MPQLVISEETVRDQAEERLEEQLVFRDAFRDLDVTDVDNNTYKVPNPEDAVAEPEHIEPGGEYPRTREEYDKVPIDGRKYGHIIEIKEEEISDSVLDVVEDQVDQAARKMAEFLDGLAYSELSANVDSASPVSPTTSGTVVYEDIQEGVTELEKNDASPDMAFFGPEAKGDILKYLADRGTDLGDEAVTTGQFGGFAGLDFMYSTAGDLAAHDVILVDSDVYGWEATFTDVESEENERFSNDTQQFKVRTRKGFRAIKPEAAIKVEG